MKRISLSVLAVFSSVVLFTSCLNNSNNTTQPPVGVFLVAQTSPDAPKVGVYINNSLFDTLHFGDYTPYVSANPGTYNFVVDSFGSTTPVLNNNLVLESNKNYSYFIIDSFSTAKSAWINDVLNIPSSDSSYVRFFNFCPNSDAINLVDSTNNNAILSANRTFNDQQNNPQYVTFTEVPAGNYIFNLKNASGSLLTTQNVTLTGGKVYTLFAKGIIGSADTTRDLSIGQIENYPQR